MENASVSVVSLGKRDGKGKVAPVATTIGNPRSPVKEVNPKTFQKT